MEVRSLYKLEEKIMAAWSIIDDIRLLAETQSDRKMSQDELENYLLGLETIYKVKFEDLFSQYEKLLQEQYQDNMKYRE
jgi:hypothetical protein